VLPKKRLLYRILVNSVSCLSYCRNSRFTASENSGINAAAAHDIISSLVASALGRLVFGSSVVTSNGRSPLPLVVPEFGNQ